MRKTILIVLLFCGLFALDFYHLNRAVEFSEIYPFKRVYKENDLLYKVDFVEEILPFGSVITEIEGNKVGKSNLIDVLKKQKYKQSISVTFEHEGREYIKTIFKEDRNSSYLTYLLLILLIANIYYIWGMFIYIIDPYQYQSRIYFLGNFMLGIFFFQLFEIFIFRDQQLILIAAILILGYLIVLLGYNISNRRIPAKIKYIFSILIIFLFSVSAYQVFTKPDYLIPVDYLLIYLVICMLFAVIKVMAKTGSVKNSFIYRRNILIILSILIGYVVPCITVLVSLFIELLIPIPIILCLTLTTPLLVGNGILQSTYYGIMHFRDKTSALVFISSLAAIISSVVLFFLYRVNIDDLFQSPYLYFTVISLALIFQGLYIFNKIYNRMGYKEKGEYAFSLQNIAELASSPEDLSFKLKNIYSEIIELTGIKEMKLVIFRDLIIDEYYFNLERYIEILPLNSDLARFLNINRKAFLKYQLIESSTLREEIVKFLDAREVSLVLPVFKGGDLKLSLLVGDKSGRRKRDEIFTNHEIQYFIGVADQLYQILENDRLYRDYITQKRYERELDNASYVQLRLFPKVVPDREQGLDINFYYRPYLRVIGDYFDFINIDDNRTAVIIGDVSGHGLSASMILSAVNSITYSMLREGMSLGKTFTEINFFLNSSFKGIELLTLFIGIYNKNTGELEYINAGHISPMLVKKEKKNVVFIENRVKILGADSEVNYSSSRTTLEKGDELILFTDGIIEIINEKNDEKLDEKRFLKIITDNIDKNIDGKINEIEKSISYFDEAIKDDITIIGVEIR